MEFTAPVGLAYNQPDFDVREEDKDEEWAAQYLRWISTHYNRPYPTWNQDATTENYRPVERGILNSLYYLGKQRNINFNHLTLDTTGNALPVRWIKSKKMKPLVDRMCGDLIKQLGAKEISATSLSKRAVSEKFKLWEEEMAVYDNRIKGKLDEMEEMFGVKFTPPLADKHNSQEEANRYKNYSFKDSLEEVATYLGTHVEESNKFDTTMIEAFRQDFCPANYMGVYYYVENGKVKSKRVPFYNLIMDISSDDPFMRDAKFCGIIERLTTQEIFKRFPSLTATQKSEILELNRNAEYKTDFFNFYNSSGMTWWADRRNDVAAIVLTGYWICQRDSGRTKAEDKYGANKYVKTIEGKKGEPVYDLYKATSIGNRYIVNYGYDDNVVKSIENSADPEMPVKMLQGNLVLGEGVSPIGVGTELIDEMDALDFKIYEMMGKHKGKGYIINGARLATDSQEFIQNMSTMGISVLYPSGEKNDPTNNQPPIFPVDMTLDDSIIKYSNRYLMLERRLESYMSLNASMLGQQSPEVGLGVQKSNIAMSTAGNLGLFKNLFEFNQMCLQYSINLAKIVYGRGEHEEIAAMVVGDRGLKVLEILQKNLFEDVLIKISPKDIITDEVRARILEMARSFAQAGTIDPLDYMRIEIGETMGQLESDMARALEKRQEREDAQAAAAEQARSQNIQQNNQGQFATVEKDGANKKELNTQNNTTKILVEDMKLDKKE